MLRHRSGRAMATSGTGRRLSKRRPGGCSRRPCATPGQGRARKPARGSTRQTRASEDATTARAKSIGAEDVSGSPPATGWRGVPDGDRSWVVEGERRIAPLNPTPWEDEQVRAPAEPAPRRSAPRRTRRQTTPTTAPPVPRTWPSGSVLVLDCFVDFKPARRIRANVTGGVRDLRAPTHAMFAEPKAGRC
jgi:hypothetical protein